MSFYGRILAFLSLRICIQLFLESDASFFKEIAFDNCLSARFFDIRVFALYSCRRMKSANAPSVSDQEPERDRRIHFQLHSPLSQSIQTHSVVLVQLAFH